jgi:hypothetical protein
MAPGVENRQLQIEKLMKTNLPIIVASLLATLGTSLVQPTACAAPRPIGDFLSRQGRYCIQVDPTGNLDCTASHYTADTTGGGCLLFLPPAANYTGWSDPNTSVSASFDYAGLADAALGGSLGTTVDGSIDEIPQNDGSAVVHVVLRARNAMTFAVQGFDFNGPLLFGHRVAEILAGAQPSLGSCTLTLVFRNSAPGAELPDVEELLICRFADVIFMSFVGNSNGILASGDPGRLEVTQEGLLRAYAHANANSRVAFDAFPAEHIIIRPTGH